MSKILITGNGFDLNLGLPTSFSDFINILNSIENDEIDFDSIYSKSSMYKTIKKNFKKFELDYEQIDLLKSELKQNLWHKFFKDELRIESWIDFENKIEYVLELLFSSVKHLKDQIFSKGAIYEGSELMYTSSLFSGDIEIIQVLNKFGIITFLNNYDIFLKKEYLTKKYGHFIDLDLDKVAKKLDQELTNFKIIFCRYFELFVYPFYDNIKIDINKNLFSDIDKHYTFNYTPTFEKIYTTRTNSTKYLHGKIDTEQNKIVLGINEISNKEIDSRYFLPFTKYFQKLNIGTDYKFLGELGTYSMGTFTFCFFGHSLDKSDSSYINEVFDFVNELNSQSNKIIVVYHNENSKSKLLVNLLSIRGKNDIEDLMKEEVLVFRNINSEELKRELGGGMFFL